MEHPDAPNNDAGVIAVVTEDEASTPMQSMELDDSQLDYEKMLTDLVRNLVANSAGVSGNLNNVTVDGDKPTRCEQSSPEDCSMPAQDDGDGCVDLRKTIPLCTSTAPEVAGAGESLSFRTALPGRVSPKGGQNPEMRIYPTLENDKCDRVAGHREENSSEGTASGCHKDEILKGAFTPKLLQETLLKACLALEEEKQAEESALVEISYCLEKISSKKTEVKSSAVALFDDCVTVEDSIDGRCYEAALSEESIVSLYSRLETVEDHVRAAYAEALNHGDANLFHRELRTHHVHRANRKTYQTPIPSNVAKKTVHLNRGKSCHNRNENFRRNRDERHTALLLQLLHFAADVRNVIVGQYRTLNKMYAIGYVYVCKIEVSCRIVLNTVKSVANVVRPALEATRIAHRAFNSMSTLETPGTVRGDPPADDVTLPDKWAQSALTHAETAIRFHDEVVLVLKEAHKQLESFKLNVSIGRDALHQSNDFEKYVLDLIQQPGDINFDELREKQTELVFLRDMLSSILEEMTRCQAHIVNSSERCSSTVEKVLVALTSATENSSNAMETSMDALIKVSVSTRYSDIED